jgi:ABC-type lipoprotein export system ATPase subunit
VTLLADGVSHSPLVAARELSLTYGRGRSAVPAVVGATFAIEEGERVAVVGPSGSGKSTLLNLIAGIDAPTSGTIEWPALGTARSLRPGPVAVAFQSAGLLPALTVLENVALPALLMGRDERVANEAAMAACSLFDVDEVAGKLPEEVSGGQAQRAGLARAVAAGPRLLLADEPTGQQDQETAEHVIGALFAWADGAGAALVVATHDSAVADRFPVRWELRDGHLSRGVVASSR